MSLPVAEPNLDLAAFSVFAICVAATAVTSKVRRNRKPADEGTQPAQEEKFKHLFTHAARMKETTQFQNSRSLRGAYRRNWAEKILKEKAYPEIRETIRNLIMTNVALMSAVLISFGLLLSGFSVLKEAGGGLVELKMVTISALLIYALFMLISESRILNYVPLLVWVDDEILMRMQGEDKVTYIAKLMDDAFDSFSDSLRAVFYAVCCILWFFNTPAFILATMMLTAFIIHSDFDRTVRITIF